MRIDASTALAFAVLAQSGVYAALLGSGISRAAQNQTGWGIVNALITRLAATFDEVPPGEPAEWYEAKFGEPVGFSELLDKARSGAT